MVMTVLAWVGVFTVSMLICLGLVVLIGLIGAVMQGMDDIGKRS